MIRAETRECIDKAKKEVDKIKAHFIPLDIDVEQRVRFGETMIRLSFMDENVKSMLNKSSKELAIENIELRKRSSESDKKLKEVQAELRRLQQSRESAGFDLNEYKQQFDQVNISYQSTIKYLKEVEAENSRLSSENANLKRTIKIYREKFGDQVFDSVKLEDKK